MAKVNNALLAYAVAAALTAGFAGAGEPDSLRVMEQQAERDPKPFVLVEASGPGFVGKAQGVVISSRGHVLSAGHVSWDDAHHRVADSFRVSLRTENGKSRPGAVHKHRAIFVDREGATFYEHWYGAQLLTHGGSRFVAKRDLCLLKIDAKAALPKIEFFSDTRPNVRTGDVLHLCHYTWPHRVADPTFLINPVEVVGVVKTTSGLQYLARGYCRWGSSGGAILKEGRLVGIQCAAYTINAKDIGEMPAGLLSFQLVWRSMFTDLLESEQR